MRIRIVFGSGGDGDAVANINSKTGFTPIAHTTHTNTQIYDGTAVGGWTTMVVGGGG